MRSKRLPHLTCKWNGFFQCVHVILCSYMLCKSVSVIAYTFSAQIRTFDLCLYYTMLYMLLTTLAPLSLSGSVRDPVNLFRLK